MITPGQIRAARALSGLTQAELASAAGISTTGLNNIERGASDPKSSTLEAIAVAFLTEGVELFEDNNFYGVRIWKDRLSPRD